MNMKFTDALILFSIQLQLWSVSIMKQLKIVCVEVLRSQKIETRKSITMDSNIEANDSLC